MDAQTKKDAKRCIQVLLPTVPGKCFLWVPVLAVVRVQNPGQQQSPPLLPTAPLVDYALNHTVFASMAGVSAASKAASRGIGEEGNLFQLR